MPGTVIFRPIQANLTQDKASTAKIDPYCTVILGDQKVKSPAGKKGTGNFEWTDSIAVTKFPTEDICYIELRDKSNSAGDEPIGVCKIDLKMLTDHNKVTKWYNIYQQDKPAGRILIEAMFTPDPYAAKEIGYKTPESKVVLKENKMFLDVENKKDKA